MHELICSKNQLKEWISYEQKKYGGGGVQNNRFF